MSNNRKRIVGNQSPPSSRLSLTDAQDELARECYRATEEWFRSKGLDPDGLHQMLRTDLLARIAELMSTERLRNIVVSDDPGGQTKQVDVLIREVGEVIAAKLVPFPTRPKAGAKRKHGSRDQEVYEMRKRGLSYGRIANHLNIKRHAAQAAYRREQKKWADFHQRCLELKRLLAPMGIVITLPNIDDGISPRSELKNANSAP